MSDGMRGWRQGYCDGGAAFEHVQNLPARISPGPARRNLSRFSIDLAARGSVKTSPKRGAAVHGNDRRHHPDAVFEMAACGGGLAGIPDTLIGPRILTPKAGRRIPSRSSMNRRCSHGAGNVAAQAVVKAFSLQRARSAGSPAQPGSAHQDRVRRLPLTMVERTVTISVLLLHLVVLAIGAICHQGQIPSDPSSPSRARSGRCPINTSPI